MRKRKKGRKRADGLRMANSRLLLRAADLDLSDSTLWLWQGRYRPDEPRRVSAEKLLNDLVSAIANRPFPRNVMCEVGVVGKQVRLLPVPNTCEGFVPIAALTPSQMRRGLRPGQWKRLGNKLAQVVNRED